MGKNSSKSKVTGNYHLDNQDDLYESFVKMPFSASLRNCSTTKRYWTSIKEALSAQIRNSAELEKVINKYNPNPQEFLALRHFFDEVLDVEQTQHFFTFILPGIIKLALRLPELLQQDILLLKQNIESSVRLSQVQVASLLANAFLSTFPSQSNLCPSINFNGLFASHFKIDQIKCVSEKLKTICHYFDRIIRNEPNGFLTFERKSLADKELPVWENVTSSLGDTKVNIRDTGLIEDDADGCLQVNFANKNVGGGVLAYGCVQEEIRFVICPELLVSRLFTEQLGPTEALIITGAERFSNYSGYGDSYEWKGDYIDNTPRDSFGRRRSAIVAIDATMFTESSEQYKMTHVLRDLNKAYAGFFSNIQEQLQPVATGNWGCGAFRGDPKLKFLLQLMACNVSKRDLVYFTFNNQELSVELLEMHAFLADNNVTVAQLWLYLDWFSLANLKPEFLYNFIYYIHFNKNGIVKEDLSSFSYESVQIQRGNKDRKNKCGVDSNEKTDNDLSTLIETHL